MMRNFWFVVIAALSLLGSAVVRADASYREQMKGLDEQVQEVKSDVLSIAAELKRLEERLLYPSNTHLAVFVELVERDTLRLDSVRIQIDGAQVAHSIYSFKELEALQKGGVQRRSPASSIAARTTRAPNVSISPRASSRSCSA
jgi:hypothetical protein